MFARSGDLSVRGCAFEVKWDGVRALVSTEDGLDVPLAAGVADGRARARAGRAARGPFLDRELPAFGDDGRPRFPLLSARVLHGKATIVSST